MHSNINPYPSHPLSWKHLGIMVAIIVAFVATGVTIGTPTAEAGLKLVLTGTVTDGPLQVEAAGKFPERFLPGVELNYQFSYRAENPENPTMQDWSRAVEALGRNIPSVEFVDVVIGRCPTGLCGTVKATIEK